MMNKKAPIIPFKGMGDIPLYSTIEELHDVLSKPDVTSTLLNDRWIRYDIPNVMMLFFHIKNHKLFKMCTQATYEGKLFNRIGTSTYEEEFCKIDPEIVYDEFEEVWESPKGYFIETEIETNTASWITIFIKELHDKNFENAEW